MDGELEKGRVNRRENAPPPILSGKPIPPAETGTPGEKLPVVPTVDIGPGSEIDNMIIASAELQDVLGKYLDGTGGKVNAIKTLAKGVNVYALVKGLLDQSNGQLFCAVDALVLKNNDKLLHPEKRYSDFEREVRVIENKSPEYVGAGEVTIVFLPTDTTIEEGIKYGLIPKWGKAIVFTTPSGFVHKDPSMTKKVFLDMIDDTESEIQKILKISPEQKINVISYSASNGAGCYTANRLLEKKNQGWVKLVATGDGLGPELESSFTLANIWQDIVKRGIHTGKDFDAFFYDEARGFLLPKFNTYNLSDDTTVVVGENDMYIALEFGMNLWRRANAANTNIKLHKLAFGHISTCLYQAYTENLRHMKIIQTMAGALDEEDVKQYDDLLSKRNIHLPPEELKLWVSAFMILCLPKEMLMNSPLIVSDEARRSLEEITLGFMVGIFPDSSQELALKVSRMVERFRPYSGTKLTFDSIIGLMNTASATVRRGKKVRQQ